MDVQFYGANCVKISTKKATLVLDDNLASIGLKPATKPGDVALFSGAHTAPATEVKLMIDQPGEYEVSDISIRGIAARSHMDESDVKPGGGSATIFKITYDDIDLVSLGHVYPELSDAQLEAIGTVDVLLVPVGGNGYTLDPVGALKLIKKIEPKLVIPTHYADKAINYEVPQQDLENALKELSMEPKETVDKLKLKSADLMTDVTQLIVVNRQ
ncbi:MAG: MBL fold metallo-hydrolase [Candidatus Saccharibacteria bacterium]|nr:MBL fold metallo-hydrolase [Candidatus Saccharibacteria bacterium]